MLNGKLHMNSCIMLWIYFINVLFIYLFISIKRAGILSIPCKYLYHNNCWNVRFLLFYLVVILIYYFLLFFSPFPCRWPCFPYIRRFCNYCMVFLSIYLNYSIFENIFFLMILYRILAFILIFIEVPFCLKVSFFIRV